MLSLSIGSSSNVQTMLLGQMQLTLQRLTMPFCPANYLGGFPSCRPSAPLIQLCSLGKGHQQNICTTASIFLGRLFCFHEHTFHLIPIPLAHLYICCCRWVQQSDVQTQLQLGIFSSSVRGLAACDDLDPGSMAITVPETLLITEDTAKESDLV